MKIVLVCTNAAVVKTFRMELIDKLLRNGHSVSVIANFDGEDWHLVGVKTINISMQNRSKNPFQSLNYYKQVKKAVAEEKPDIVMTFMIKPNTFGVLAVSKCPGVRIYSMVEGMGVVYTDDSIVYKILRIITDLLYKKAMKRIDGLFCLNKYDAAYFTDKKYIEAEKVHVLSGIGLDLKKFEFSPVCNFKKFVIIARLLKEKGIEEFCKAAEIIKNKYPEAEFCIYGSKVDNTQKIINEYERKKVIEYRGTTNNVPEVLKESTALVLPTYREGSSRIIMEAMSVGRPVIASNTIGCNHLVDVGKNGILTPIKDVQAIADAIEFLIQNPDKVVEYGRNSRKKAENEFDSEVVNSKILEIIEKGVQK